MKRRTWRFAEGGTGEEGAGGEGGGAKGKASGPTAPKPKEKGKAG